MSNIILNPNTDDEIKIFDNTSFRLTIRNVNEV